MYELMKQNLLRYLVEHKDRMSTPFLKRLMKDIYDKKVEVGDCLSYKAEDSFQLLFRVGIFEELRQTTISAEVGDDVWSSALICDYRTDMKECTVDITPSDLLCKVSAEIHGAFDFEKE